MKTLEAVTLGVARRAMGYRIDNLPAMAREIATQCIIDWFAVTIAALKNPVHTKLLATVRQEKCAGSASIIGYPEMYPATQAALVNGATAHALDFDDVNLAISGHPSAVIFSALLALGQRRGSTGKAILSAFIAGYETVCRVGALVNPDHMNRGFHATSTIGGFGAAAACSKLLGFNAQQTAEAMGLAATNAAGLKAMFGTMVKPLHAGLAARNGLESALLVSSGYRSRSDILECPQGFAAAHSSDFNVAAALEDLPSGLHLYNNLFKYDASCYGTHATIECIRQLKTRYGIRPNQVRRVDILVDRTINALCNIQSPDTGLQGQFSIRLNAAFGLLGIDTADLNSYSDEQVNDPSVRQLLDKITVTLADDWPSMQAEATITDHDGQQYRYKHDAGQPQKDIEVQSQRIADKFMTLSSNALGDESAADLLKILCKFAELKDLDQITRLCSTAGARTNRSVRALTS